MNKLISLFVHKLIPRIAKYSLLEYNPINKNHSCHAHHDIVRITHNSIRDFDEVRPNYQDIARNYLDTGHNGYAIYIDGRIASVAWSYLNKTQQTLRIKGYYPLRPGCAFLHAAWTHPKYRGNGLHRELIHFRLNHILTQNETRIIETNIATSNIASLKNYRKIGFEPTGSLNVYSWLGFTIARKY